MIDQVEEILQAEDIPNDLKADIWDHYFSTLDANSLGQKLSGVPIGGFLKSKLIAAKRESEPTNLDRAVQAIHRLSTLDPVARDLAEKHPSVLKALMARLQHGEE